MGPMMIFIIKAFGTLPVYYFVCHNRSIESSFILRKLKADLPLGWVAVSCLANWRNIAYNAVQETNQCLFNACLSDQKEARMINKFRY